MADLYKEPENSKKGWFSGTWFSHDKAILGAWKLQKGSKFFQEPEIAKKAHIQAPEIAKMVDRFFMNQIMATNNFAFKVKAILGFESTHLESQVAKIGLKDPLDY